MPPLVQQNSYRSFVVAMSHCASHYKRDRSRSCRARLRYGGHQHYDHSHVDDCASDDSVVQHAYVSGQPSDVSGAVVFHDDFSIDTIAGVEDQGHRQWPRQDLIDGVIENVIPIFAFCDAHALFHVCAVRKGWHDLAWRVLVMFAMHGHLSVRNVIFASPNGPFLRQSFPAVQK